MFQKGSQVRAGASYAGDGVSRGSEETETEAEKDG